MISKGCLPNCAPAKNRNMKGLFIVFHGFSAYSGISKKIFAQCDAMRRCGIDTELCYNRITDDGEQLRMVGDTSIRSFGRGIRAKIGKRISYGDITQYIRREGVKVVYIRHDLNANPMLIGFLRALKRLGVRILLEIPTYPYDCEFAQSSLSSRLKLQIDRLFRHRMAHYVDRIVTFSEQTEIFGCPTIRISNGIDFDAIPLKTEQHDTRHEVHLLAVANIHFWHGFDRIIAGLSAYYATPRERIVRLHLVGDGIPALFDEFRAAISNGGLTPYVEILGPLSGTALDAQFAWSDLGIASLARHRNGITAIKTLKNREYAARGIPFVYSETDSDFDTKPYVFKAPADETPIDVEALLSFFDALRLTPAQIRGSIEGTLSWERQMRLVMNELGL